MNRLDFFKYQVVGQADLDMLEDAIELADTHGLDAFSLGTLPIRGLVPTADGTTLTLSVSAGFGLAADASGNPRFTKLGAPGSISLSGVVPASNPKWVLAALHFKRNAYQDETDGDGVAIKYHSDEASELVLVQGAEGAGKPAIPVDHVPICDVLLAVAQAALKPTDLDLSRARPAYGKQGTAGGVAAQLADLAGLQLDNCRGYVVEPASASANAMKIGVRPGRINFPDKSVTVAGGTVTVPASPSGGKHRITMVWIDSAGALQQTHGAEVVYAADAVAPSFEGKYPVAVYDVLDTTAALSPSSLVDVRPMARAARDVPNRYTMVAAGGETVITPGWSFIPGAHALQAYDNGVLIDESSYTEASDGLSITLGAGAIAGHRITLYATRVAASNPVVSHASTHAADGADPIDHLGGLVHGLEMGAGSSDDATFYVRRFTAVIGGRIRTLASPVEPDVSGLGAGAWGYVYAYMNGATVAVEVSTTVPDSSVRFKSGDTSRTYLGCVRKTSTGKIRAFRRRGRHTQYLIDYTLTSTSGAARNLLMGSITGDTNPHSISCVEAVPPHVLAADIAVDLTGGSGQYVQIDGGGLSATAGKAKFYQHNADTKPLYQRMLVDLDVNNAFTATMSSAAGVTARFWVDGYED